MLDNKTKRQSQSLLKKTKALTDEKLAHKATKQELYNTKNDLKEAQDFVAVLTQENLELTKQIKDLQNRFIKGGVVYTINNGYVSNAIELPTDSEYTFKQSIPKGIGSKLYHRFPFVKVTNRQLTIDETQYKKYKGAIL